MGVTTGVEQNGTQTEGGVYQKQSGGCHPPPVVISLSLFGFFVLDRTTQTVPGEGEDGSDPPFLAAGAARLSGGWYTRCTSWCTTPHPPLVGSLPPECIHAGRLRRPPTGAGGRADEGRDA